MTTGVRGAGGEPVEVAAATAQLARGERPPGLGDAAYAAHVLAMDALAKSKRAELIDQFDREAATLVEEALAEGLDAASVRANPEYAPLLARPEAGTLLDGGR